MLRYTDETCVPRTFNIKIGPFPCAKISYMFHYLIPILNKRPDYIVMHVGTNDAVDAEVIVIVDKLLHLKCFVKRNYLTVTYYYLDSFKE